MSIIGISRDWPSSAPAMVRIESTNTLAEISGATYLTDQADNILLINHGAFEWLVTDFVLAVGSDGWGLYSIDPDFTQLTPFAVSSSGVNILSSDDGLTAHAGGGQALALQIAAAINRITIVATADDSVKLPVANGGMEIVLINDAANPMQVFGAGTDTINDIASGTGVSQLGNSAVLYVSSIAGKWYSIGLGLTFIGSGDGLDSLGIHSALSSGSFATASSVITDPAITAASVVIARFVSSANVVTTQTVLPAAGSFTIVTDTAPSTGVLEYISYIPSAELQNAGIIVGKGSYGGGSATFVIADADVTAGMVVNANFQSQVTPSRIYTVTAGAGTLTFVCSANPGVSVIEYAAILPSAPLSALGLEAVNHAYAGGFASIVISDANITASSIVTADFKSQSVVALIQKVTPSAGTLTILASIDPGASVVAYTATSGAVGGQFLTSTNNLSDVVSASIAATNLGLGTTNDVAFAGIIGSKSSASATPGTIRVIKGLMTESNAVMTSGTITGVRGEVDMVGASGGFAYGVQGKVIPTGTLSGSIWAPAVFGQYDLSAATLNAGQIAAIWGDMGATGGTFTNVTGARMFAGTNTIASLTLNSMIYLYGKASALFELAGDAGSYISAGAATPSGDLKKIAITIDGVVHYILAAAVWS